MVDAEKVIDGLGRVKHKYISDSVTCMWVDEAIQTIRELQSKEEEVCEWKRMEDDWYSFEPTCDSDVGYRYPENMICEWKDCPYCGRQIKVVE